MSKKVINILISTIDDRINHVEKVLLNPRDDIKYIIFHQYMGEAYKRIPPNLKRSDVTIFQMEGKGLSKSRNYTIKLATGDIALFADDDLTYRPNYIKNLINAFLSNPDADVILFKIKTSPDEPEYKNYPEYKVDLKDKLLSISTPEIAFKVESVKKLGLFFDERFGAGQELLIGSEETIFIEDCLKKGLKVIFVPEYITEHPYESTIKSIPRYDKRRNWVTGAYDCRTNGQIALLKAFFGTIKILPELLKNGVNPFIYFYHRLSAVLYILQTNKNSSLEEYKTNFPYLKS